jgi:hypothetical protein
MPDAMDKHVIDDESTDEATRTSVTASSKIVSRGIISDEMWASYDVAGKCSSIKCQEATDFVQDFRAATIGN